MKMAKKYLALVLALAMVFSLAACGGSQNPESNETESSKSNDGTQTYVIQYTHNQTEDSPQHKGILAFKEKLEELTNGQITVEIYPNNQLGSMRESMESVQNGTTQMTQQPTNMISNFVSEAMIADLPYLFNKEEECYNAFDGTAGDLINEKFEQYNMVNLGWVPIGAKVFTSSKPLTCLADFKGQQLRAMEGPIVINTFEALGAGAVPMNFSELYNALQQHVVDGEENPYQTLYMTHFYEVQEYILETFHCWLTYGHVINKQFWDSLGPDLQAKVQEAMDYSLKVMRETNAADEELYRKTCEEYCTIITPEGQALQDLKDATHSVWDFTRDYLGAEFFDEFVSRAQTYVE